MNNESTHICIISTQDEWANKVADAATTLNMTSKRFSSVSSFFASENAHGDCACIFLDFDARIQDWGSIESVFLQKGITVPAVVVVDENGGLQSAEAIKHLAHLVAMNSMESNEIIQTIRQAGELQKVIDHQFAVQRYHKLLGDLNAREREIVNLVVSGAPNKQIATKLNLSVKTIERDRQSAYRKLDVRSTAEMTKAVILGDLHDVTFGMEGIAR